MKLRHVTLILAVATIAGCSNQLDESGAADGKSSEAATSPANQPPPALPGLKTPGPMRSQPETVRKPAVAGVGRKGRDYGTGPIATPIASYFNVRQRIAFMSIVTPMNMYRVEHGHFPKTHDEFIEEIIEKNSIKLPELPARERYVYDAEKAAKMTSYDVSDPPLMVERVR